MEDLKNIILSLDINSEEKERLLKQLKAVQKTIDSAEFRYQRTIMDKAAITNILNASISEIEKQKAVIEKQKKEATHRASLDSIRAEIASMRTTKDLEKITPLIWLELNILNIPFVRSGVVLVHDEDTEKLGIYLATPDGKSIASLQINANQTVFSQKIFNSWKKKQALIDQWNETTFLEWANSLVKLGAIASAEDYLMSNPIQNLYLHFLPFPQGMLYVGNVNLLTEEELSLAQSLADTISTAYARYEDFNKLDAAKQQVDNTLKDLRSAQQQLIQSEKMASLGELTAGIAHEIQNPLNFVNNFSELNKELITELVEEVKKGNTADVDLLANDIKENSEKINFHGKRAGDIVKGMLQHSRKSEGKKEPTDINALCDEYLRLSYHGLRAKDKAFNAKFETSFDETLPEIKVVTQDLGRVILNLINNAFYSVTEKKNQLGEGYEPTVKISTKHNKGTAEIRVYDNGNGVPASIKDKILRPVFTTEPAGLGTGLGLSLSYDIIAKVHSGNLTVESREGEFAEFIIQLPL